MYLEITIFWVLLFFLSSIPIVGQTDDVCSNTCIIVEIKMAAFASTFSLYQHRNMYHLQINCSIPFYCMSEHLFQKAFFIANYYTLLRCFNYHIQFFCETTRHRNIFQASIPLLQFCKINLIRFRADCKHSI